MFVIVIDILDTALFCEIQVFG